MQYAMNNSEQGKEVVKKVKLDYTVLSNYIQDIRDRMDDYVIGQNDAKNALCDALVRSLVFDPSRRKPLGSFMFLGPSGVGKTELVRALFKILYGDDNIELGSSKIDCNTIKDSHDGSAILLGPPPGFVGSEIIPLLADTYVFKHFNESKNLHPMIRDFEDFGIILLDEVEKAHPDFYDIFLGMMDEGVVELRTGNAEKQLKTKGVVHSKVTKFRNVLLIMTSNLGAKELSKKASGKHIPMGFVSSDDKLVIPKDFYKQQFDKSNFRPEFIKRLTDYVPFDFFTKKDYYTLLEKLVRDHNKKYSDRDIEITLSKKLKSFFVTEALKENIGGRSLVTNFEAMIDTNFVKLLFNGEISKQEISYNKNIKTISFDINGNEVITLGIFEHTKAREKQHRKNKRSLTRRKLCSDEVVVSLYGGSFLLTLRNQITPKVSYLRSLYLLKDKISEDFENEIEEIEMELELWGLTDVDFSLIKKKDILDKYDDFQSFYGEVEGLRLWGDKQFINTFDGKLRFIDKYIRYYFKQNDDSKYLVNSGAGSMDEILIPVIDTIENIISRKLTFEEESIVISIFHREYIKLFESPPKIESKDKDENKVKVKVSDSSKVKKSSLLEKLSNQRKVVVNINLHDSKKKGVGSYKKRLRKLFKNDYKHILALIRTNLKNSEDIAFVLEEVKAEIGNISEKQQKSLLKAIKTIKKKKKEK
ncbi:ATP-dependent Clp protease ATP-binding subunit [bacterium]|jgi:hypothetical protein|nr:ATP-dependent Clp protease ATP-binding subunit [bacterium]